MCAQVAPSAEYLRGHGRVAVDVTALPRPSRLVIYLEGRGFAPFVAAFARAILLLWPACQSMLSCVAACCVAVADCQL